MTGRNIVLEKMPHELLLPAPPFLFVDRVEAYDGRTLHCRKDVSYNEPHFAGHFPGNPILPGVLLIEMANQAGALLAVARRGLTFSEGYLARTRDFTFYHPVRPGDSLEIVAAFTEELDHYFIAKVRIRLRGEGRKVARGEVVLYLR